MKVLEINIADLKSNLEIIKNRITENGNNTNIIAVVKANRNGTGTSRIF